MTLRQRTPPSPPWHLYLGKIPYSAEGLFWVSFESDPGLRRPRENLYGRCLPCIQGLYDQLRAGRQAIALGSAYHCWKVTAVLDRLGDGLALLASFEALFPVGHVYGRLGNGRPGSSQRAVVFQRSRKRKETGSSGRWGGVSRPWGGERRVWSPGPAPRSTSPFWATGASGAPPPPCGTRIRSRHRSNDQEGIGPWHPLTPCRKPMGKARPPPAPPGRRDLRPGRHLVDSVPVYFQIMEEMLAAVGLPPAPGRWWWRS